MKKLFIIFVLFILAPLSSVNAYGEIKGTSLGEFSSCDYYLIEDSLGSYSLVEWYGGSTPYSGNTVVGELHSYGFKDLYNISMDNSTHVWIDDWLLSEDSAAKKLIEKCGYDRSISTYFDGGGYYVPSYTPPVTSAPTCPANSSSVKGVEGKISCSCISGYNWNGSQCIKDVAIIEAPKTTIETKKPDTIKVPEKILKIEKKDVKKIEIATSSTPSAIKISTTTEKIAPKTSLLKRIGSWFMGWFK